MSRDSASGKRRTLSNRRRTDGFLPLGYSERRIQAERRGIKVMEFDFDERIVIGMPKPRE